MPPSKADLRMRCHRLSITRSSKYGTTPRLSNEVACEIDCYRRSRLHRFSGLSLCDREHRLARDKRR